MLNITNVAYDDFNTINITIKNSNTYKEYLIKCNIIQMLLHHKEGGKGQPLLNSIYNDTEEYRSVDGSILVISNDNKVYTIYDNDNIEQYENVSFIKDLHDILQDNIYTQFKDISKIMIIEATCLINKVNIFPLGDNKLNIFILKILSDKLNCEYIQKELDNRISEEACLSKIFSNNNFLILDNVKFSDIFKDECDTKMINLLLKNNIETIKDYIEYMSIHHDICNIKGIGIQYKDKINSKINYIMYLL